MNAQRRTGSYGYTEGYTTARHRFTPDQDRTPNPARFPASPARAFMPGHRPLATLDMHHPAGGAVLVVQPVCWPINAHFRADTGSRSVSARPRTMPRMPRRKRGHVSLLPMMRHAKYMLYDQHRRGLPVARRGDSGSPVHTIHHIPGKEDIDGKKGGHHDPLGAAPHVTNHRRRRRHGDGSAEGYRTVFVLARLLQQQETHSRARHALYIGRNCGTLLLLNPTGRMCKAVRTRFLGDKLRFKTGCGLRARSRHHHRLELCSPD